jgi:hypothetical protein
MAVVFALVALVVACNADGLLPTITIATGVEMPVVGLGKPQHTLV